MDWLFLVLSLLVLTAGAEALVRGASALALRMGMSPLFVGLTIVGFGTSSPEMGASLAATLRGSGDVSVGNVVGSNIFNVAAILGVVALIRPIRIRLIEIRRDLVVAVAAAAMPWLALGSGGTIPRVLGGVLVGALVAYLLVAYRAARRAPATAAGLTMGPPRGSTTLHVGLTLLGLALLSVGSRTFVDSALVLGRAHHVPELVLGLTVVAGGTSLPELLTSLVATMRGNPDLAVGNIVGSNIFNVFGILGVCALVQPQTVNPWVLAVDTPVMMVATLALVPILRRDGCITRTEGALLLLGYGVYLATLLRRTVS